MAQRWTLQRVRGDDWFVDLPVQDGDTTAWWTDETRLDVPRLERYDDASVPTTPEAVTLHGHVLSADGTRATVSCGGLFAHVPQAYPVSVGTPVRVVIARVG